MFPFKTRTNQFFTLGVVFALSLVSISALLVIVAFASQIAPEPQAPSQVPIVQVEPTLVIVENGEIFRINIGIRDAANLGSFQFVLSYNPSIIEVPKQPNPMILGPFAGSTGRIPSESANDIDPVTGVITYRVYTTGGGTPGPYGEGVLAFVDLRARNLGTATLKLTEVEVTDIGGNIQNTLSGDGLVVVASSPNPAQVSVSKSADSPVVTSLGVMTYTVQRNFSLVGQHSYNEIVFDPIPDGVTCLADSVTLNGLPAPQLYSSTLNAIYYQHSDIFTDINQWDIAFQVRVASVPSGTLIVNTVTQTVSFDGAAYSGPYTATESTLVSCTDVGSVDLSLMTVGEIYTDTSVAFSADISPDEANKPYTYSVDYDDGTTPDTLASSDDPLAFNHTFATAGSHDVTISVWNCAMSAPMTDTVTVTVSQLCQEVSDVDLERLTGGDIFPGANVAFSADISPDSASKPYTYSVDYDDDTTPSTLTSSDDPLALNHTFAAAGSYDVAISVWNCAMSVPIIDTLTVTVSQPCQEVSNVELIRLTGGYIYTDTNVAFSANILPNDANKPYTYSIDYDDGTTPVTLTSSDDPLAFNHTFATTGTYTVEIAVWNCAMMAIDAVTGIEQVHVIQKGFLIHLPIVTKSY